MALGLLPQAFDQLEQADQEAMAAEREDGSPGVVALGWQAQRARKRMEDRGPGGWLAYGQAVERNFEEVRCQRREKFMECFHKAQKWHQVTCDGVKSLFCGAFFLRLYLFA